MGRTVKKAETAKEKTLFPGNNFFAPAAMAVLLVSFAFCFISARDKAVSESRRWQQEAKYELSRLESSNHAEIRACQQSDFMEGR